MANQLISGIDQMRGLERRRTAMRIQQTLQELETTAAEKGLFEYYPIAMEHMEHSRQCLKTMITTLEEKENWTRSKESWELVERTQARNLLTFVRKLNFKRN